MCSWATGKAQGATGRRPNPTVSSRSRSPSASPEPALPFLPPGERRWTTPPRPRFDAVPPATTTATTAASERASCEMTTTLFVANLPDWLPDEDFSREFDQLDGVSATRVKRDRNRNIVGFVDFVSSEAADAARAMYDGWQGWSSKGLRIQLASKRRNAPPQQQHPAPAPASNEYDPFGPPQTASSAPDAGRARDPRLLEEDPRTRTAAAPFSAPAPASAPTPRADYHQRSPQPLSPPAPLPPQQHQHQQPQQSVIYNQAPQQQPQVIYATTHEAPRAPGAPPQQPQQVVFAPSTALPQGMQHIVVVPQQRHAAVGGPQAPVQQLIYAATPAPAGPPLPLQEDPGRLSTLYVECLPPGVIEREVAHIFRPFPGFSSLRLVRKQNKPTLCFVQFRSSAEATLAMDKLQVSARD